MAKGRSFAMRRSERYLGSYTNGHSHESTVADESELREQDVWSAVDDDVGNRSTEPNQHDSWRPRSSVPRNGRVGGLSLAFVDSMSSSPRIVHQICGNERSSGCGGDGRDHQMATSAPVNVPDWSKIYRVNSVESMHESEEDEGCESGMVPPHEYLARSQARRSGKVGVGSSVFEGVGRTLKGRDMRRVRDAVWSQTGFYG